MRRILAILALFIVLTLCILAGAQMQNVGGDFGRSWLTQNANRFSTTPSANTSNDLWNWGSNPQGYEVIRGQLYPLIAPTQTFYPMFMSNATPIVINGTAFWSNMNYISPDFMTPDFMNSYYLYPDYISDPWFLAQITERPVIVRYPADSRGSRLR